MIRSLRIDVTEDCEPSCTYVLAIETRAFGRATPALNHGAISPASTVTVLKRYSVLFFFFTWWYYVNYAYVLTNEFSKLVLVIFIAKGLIPCPQHRNGRGRNNMSTAQYK